MSESLDIYIICDGNAEVGYGHFFRCLHFVNALKTHLPALNVTWLGALDQPLWAKVTADKRPEESNLAVSDFGYDKTLTITRSTDQGAPDDNAIYQEPSNSVSRYIPVKNAKHALSQIMLLSRSWVLADSYLLKSEDLGALARQHHLIAIDDFGRHSYLGAQAVLNFCVSASQYAYQASTQFLGAGYFLTDPRLNAVRAKKLSISLDPNRNNNILIAMGGFDRFDVGAKIALALNESQINTKVTLLGSSKQRLPKAIEHLTRSNNMAELYQRSDLVISGGGLIKYESAYCATMNIAVSQTTEQLSESEAFAKHNLCLSYGLAQDWHKDSFITWFEALDLTAQRARLIAASAQHFVTNSTDRAAQALAILIMQ